MKFNVGKKLLGMAGGFALSALVAWPAHAITTLDFGTGGMGAGGTITAIAGGFSGSNIPVDALTVSGAPLNNGVWDTQGTATGSGATAGDPNAAALSFNTVTGAITIVGGVSGLGVPLGSTLLVNLGPAAITCSTQAGGVVLSCSGSGNDTKDRTLLAALGINPLTTFNLFGFSITNATWNGTSGTVTSTDIVNTQGKIPEPASMLLFGLGLVGLAAWGRKRLSK